MDRQVAWQVIDEQREAVAALLSTLTPQQWDTPSLCEAWTVKDVGAHLDILVHGQDIARPLQIPHPMPVEAARVAAEWAWERGYPFMAARRFRGVSMVADDIDWRRGEGAELRGPVASLLLLSTGRMVALDEVSGPGVAVVRAGQVAA